MNKKMIGILTCILMVASSIVMAGPTAAHWDEDQGDTHKMHWAQTPDTSDTGVAVDMPFMQIRGDDFLCTETGYINDIHLWGAFKNDILPHNGPGSMYFLLQIYSDKPASNDTKYSHPSHPYILLWQVTVGPTWYTVAETTYPDQMDWYYLDGSGVTPDTHTKVFQFNFHFEDDVACPQQEGTIYWLVVKRVALADGDFGWMTTKNELHWNDHAVRPIAVWPFWEALEHPSGDPVDLAFVINGTTSSTPPPVHLLPWDLFPLKLNLKSNGKSVMTKIDPPEGYDKDDIDLNELMLQDSIPVSQRPEVGKIGHGEGNDKLMLKFDRSDLEDILSPGTHNLKISGQLVDGTPFVGYSNPVSIWDEPPNLPPTH